MRKSILVDHLLFNTALDTVESPNNGQSGTGLLSVVERCPLLGDCFSIRSTDLNSIRTTRSVRCRGLSASRDVRFGRLHCIPFVLLKYNYEAGK